LGKKASRIRKKKKGRKKKKPSRRRDTHKSSLSSSTEVGVVQKRKKFGRKWERCPKGML